MKRFIVFSALVAVAAAQDGYSYGAPPTTEPGYDYKEPENPFGAGNNPDSSVVKPEEDHHHGSSDPLQWLRDAVKGEPGQDYPIYATIPPTGFSCEGRVAGYYADVEAGCQPFHVCSPVPNGESIMLSFLCPNGTIFNQEGFSCKWWYDVDCQSSEQFYSKNEEIGVVPESAASNSVSSVVGGPTTQRPQYEAPQTSRPQSQQPRPRPQPQPSRPRPQQVRPVPNQYIPPTTTTTVRPPPGLYNLPRN